MDKTAYEKLFYTIDPVDSEMARNLKKKLDIVYTRVKAKAYFVTNDTIKIYHGENEAPFKLDHVPASLIIAHLVNRSSTMLEGSPGSGKTKIAKIVSRLMTGSSINDAENIIYCDEELSKEKWMAFPNVQKMIQQKSIPNVMEAIALLKKWIGNSMAEELLNDKTIDTKQIKNIIETFEKLEKKTNDLAKSKSVDFQTTDNDSFDVIWAPFFRLQRNGIDLIVDEINRTNPKTQSEFLSLMAEGIAQYAVSARMKIEDFRLYFTQNPLDDIIGGEGIYRLGFAFKDRITQWIQVPQPPMYAMKMVSEVRRDDRNYEYDEDTEIKPVMTVDEIRSATILASKIPVTENAKKYARYIVRDMSLCLRAPSNDKTLSKSEIAGRELCKGCHFDGVTTYHCKKFYGGSMRMYNDLIAVGKAYAFWLGLKEVNEYLIRSIAIDVVSHRILILPEKLREDKKYGKNPRNFLQHYLIDWCFSLLQTRNKAEDAFNRLYEGTSTSPEEDIQKIILNAQNDLYVRIDLLPKVIEIGSDGDDIDNLKENKSGLISSTNSNEYREKAREIFAIERDEGLSIKEKFSMLNRLSNEIATTDIHFSSNLIDMIYAIYPKLNAARERERISSEEKTGK